MKYFMPLILILLFSCSKPSKTEPQDNFTLSADLSSLPMLESKNIIFYEDSVATGMLRIMYDNGFRTIRMRLWKNPAEGHSGFAEVKAFAKKVHSYGMKVWLSVHYSDTWADPGQQSPPAEWEGLTFNDLKDSAYNYTVKIMKEIKPDIIQIGNEINQGFILPYGDIYENEGGFLDLVSRCSKAVRDNSSAKIMIHYAGYKGSLSFFSKLQNIDYDLIGLSYYPIWHGKNLDSLKYIMNSLSSAYGKRVAIAETAYPFTLMWNDWTNNIVGMKDQLILPDFPATENGQGKFFEAIVNMVKNEEMGFGVSYWGAELVAFNGPEAKDGSPWENQAFFDFNNQSLPILKVLSSKTP
ncbi:MAG: arabinogalactan endo-1,4-beta-galactosidase [Chlorobi bacterium]|nr:arabinogalactan endo-1,4-beta-galactosidase [Chlorobiota bacterium]